MKNKVEELQECGQSVWIDAAGRSMLRGGWLAEMIGRGLHGMTTNPTIFENAITDSAAYDADIEEFGPDTPPRDIYERLVIKDVREAADLFLSVFRETRGGDGFVSLEIDPHLADKTQETVVEAVRLHRMVDRPNIMIKIPSTVPGCRAIEELTARGINVNATLIFSLRQYMFAAQAYMRGIERRIRAQEDVRRIRSVASVFVSRIDVEVDRLIALKVAEEGVPLSELEALRGTAAVANCVLCYDVYRRLFTADDFALFAEQDANVQKVVWASTGNKDPRYNDIKYVSGLIGQGTVNAMPENTLRAFMDHGAVCASLPADPGWARATLERLVRYGIDVDIVCERLLREGVRKFEKSYDSLLGMIGRKSTRAAV